jgi:hypothetical protein
MRLVSVHGVANRRGQTAAEKAAFGRSVLARDGLFRTIALAYITGWRIASEVLPLQWR